MLLEEHREVFRLRKRVEEFLLRMKARMNRPPMDNENARPKGRAAGEGGRLRTDGRDRSCGASEPGKTMALSGQGHDRIRGIRVPVAGNLSRPGLWLGSFFSRRMDVERPGR